MNKLQLPGQPISRQEQKQIEGGYLEFGDYDIFQPIDYYEPDYFGFGGGVSIGGGPAYLLVCSTPNGQGYWPRRSNAGDADYECRKIYPAYGSNVTGFWMNNPG